MIYNNKKNIDWLISYCGKKKNIHIFCFSTTTCDYTFFPPEESSVPNVFLAPLRECSPVVEKLTTSLLMTLFGPKDKDTVFYVQQCLV